VHAQHHELVFLRQRVRFFFVEHKVHLLVIRQPLVVSAKSNVVFPAVLTVDVWADLLNFRLSSALDLIGIRYVENVNLKIERLWCDLYRAIIIRCITSKPTKQNEIIITFHRSYCSVSLCSSTDCK
jgi:hypothetical protein